MKDALNSYPFFDSETGKFLGHVLARSTTDAMRQASKKVIARFVYVDMPGTPARDKPLLTYSIIATKDCFAGEVKAVSRDAAMRLARERWPGCVYTCGPVERIKTP